MTQPNLVDPQTLDILAPNLKRRYSGVTSTIMRLVPLQFTDMRIATVGPVLPAEVPQIRLRDLVTLSRSGPNGARVWHARRNTEMLAGLILKHILRKNLKLLFTSAAQRHHSRYTKWLIRRMDALIATSGKSARYLDLPSTVIRHGIDISEFAPTLDKHAVRQRLGLDPDALIIGCFGRIRPQKGNDLFIDAMLDLLPNRPDVQAIIMGGVTQQFESFAADLRSRVAASPCRDRIHFLSEVPGWTIAPWFQAVDLYVAPQRNEGFGLTPLEAMACGAAVVATRVGAFEELVKPGETGLIVRCDDQAALTQAIADALSDRARLKQWGDAGPPHVASRFRIQDEAAAINAVYRELLA
ncbi:MAG: glycosyltransferase family 4 protein [Rhodobacteraceae bacterium]|nr:glycosyltransferase family 4 protein [Paracoccaceae bacterium]